MVVSFLILKGKQRMAIFSDLKNKIINAKKHKANKNEFTQLLMQIVSDGYISDAELEQINQLAQAYDIQDEDLLAINTKVYRHAFNAVLNDGIITEQEALNLVDIANTLLVNPNTIANELAVLERHRQLRLIQHGVLPIIHINGVVLLKNEVIHFAVPASLIEEKVVHQGYTGGSAGVSIRVAQGVNLKLGASKGRLVKKTGIVPVAHGTVILTNQRILFVSQKKAFNLKFNRLVSYKIYTDGMDFIPATGNPKCLSIQQYYDSDMFQLILMVLLQKSQ